MDVIHGYHRPMSTAEAMDPSSPAQNLTSVGPVTGAAGLPLVDGTAAIHDAQAMAAAVGLSPVEASILDFEREWWRFSGAKEQSIRERFDMTPAHYHQVLGALLDDARALAYDPILVKRLTRLRHARHQARTARRSAG